MPCPSDDQLKQLSRANCDESFLDSMAEHLPFCGACTAKLFEQNLINDQLVDWLRQRLPTVHPGETSDFGQLVDRMESHLAKASEHDPRNADSGSPPVSTVTLNISDTDDDMAEPVSRSPTLTLPRLENYVMQEILGRGGMGVVVKARQLNLNRDVAIKFPLHLTDDLQRERFLREAQAAGRFRHPHICPIYEVGEAGDRPYMVMAFIEGQTLRRWAHESEHTLRESAEMVACIARGMQFAHEQSIIHRDLKPDNVLVDSTTGLPVLTDFGLAKDLGVQGEGMTQSGQVMGTASYMAPEQAAGKTAEIGPLADVYSLGAILYELLCKTPPFRGTLGEVLKKVQTEDPAPPRRLVPTVHPDIETICLKALKKSPDARYATAGELADDLERFARGEAILARRETMPQKAARHLRKHQKTYGIGFAIAVLVLIAATYLISSSLDSQRKAEFAEQRREWNEALNKDAHQWQRKHVESLQTLKKRMAELDPSRGPTRDEELKVSLVKVVRRSILESPRISLDEESRIRELIGLVEELAPDRVEELQASLQERLVRPELVFELNAPVLPGDPAYRLDEVACRGNVELTAQFSPGWESANQVGLILNASDPQQYEFVLQTEPQSSLGFQRNFRAFIRENRPARLVIQRREGKQTHLLRDEPISLKDLAEAPLRMKATRTRQRLSVWIGNLPPVHFEDWFPVQPQDQGVFSLVWPEDVELASVRAYRQTRPRTATPLLAGDTAFAASDFDTALAEYRREQTTTDPQIRQEVMFKQALCYLQLQDLNRARAALKGVVQQRQDNEDPWSIRAICQLWLLELKQGNIPTANTYFRQLRAMHGGISIGKLTLLIPASDREEILKRYGSMEDWLFFTPQTVENLEHAHEITRFLSPDSVEEFVAGVQLVKAYHMDGRMEDAQRLCEDMFEQFEEMFQDHYGFTIMVVEQYGWLMRQQGPTAVQAALEQLDHYAMDKQGQLRDGGWSTLLVERARLNHALGHSEQAQQDLDQFFTRHAFVSSGYSVFMSAALLQGFLLMDQEQEIKGLQVWKSALSNETYRTQSIQGSFSPLVSRTIMAAMTNQVTEEEINHLIDWLQRVVPQTGKFYFGLTLARLPRSPIKAKMQTLLKELWQKSHGRQLARQIAYRTLPYRDYVYEPIYASGLVLAKQRIFGEGMSSGQEDYCLKFLRNSHRIFSANKPLRGQIQSIAELVLSSASLATWEAIKPQLKEQPALMGGIAYFCGKRCQMMGRNEDANTFFKFAQSVSPVQSEVGQLVQTELKGM